MSKFKPDVMLCGQLVNARLIIRREYSFNFLMNSILLEHRQVITIAYTVCESPSAAGRFVLWAWLAWEESLLEV